MSTCQKGELTFRSVRQPFESHTSEALGQNQHIQASKGIRPQQLT